MHKPILRALVLGAALALPVTAGHAQTQPNADAMGGVGTSQTVTVRAKVRAIDMKTRNVTLVGPEGNAITVRASDEVRNLGQVKKGDTVVVRYTRSAVIVLSQGGQPTPPNTATVTGSRAAPGQPPAAEAANRLVVTGTVVGIDMQAHTLQLVNPKGGPVVTVDVTDPERQRQMSRISVGDNLTVIYTEAVAISVEPVHH